MVGGEFMGSREALDLLTMLSNIRFHKANGSIRPPFLSADMLLERRYLVARPKKLVISLSDCGEMLDVYVYDHLRILQQSAEPHRFDIWLVTIETEQRRIVNRAIQALPKTEQRTRKYEPKCLGYLGSFP